MPSFLRFPCDAPEMALPVSPRNFSFLGVRRQQQPLDEQDAWHVRACTKLHTRTNYPLEYITCDWTDDKQSAVVTVYEVTVHQSDGVVFDPLPHTHTDDALAGLLVSAQHDGLPHTYRPADTILGVTGNDIVEEDAAPEHALDGFHWITETHARGYRATARRLAGTETKHVAFFDLDPLTWDASGGMTSLLVAWVDDVTEPTHAILTDKTGSWVRVVTRGKLRYADARSACRPLFDGSAPCLARLASRDMVYFV